MSPHKSGKYYNGSEVFDKPFMVEQETMPEYFKRIGYNTYGKGKLFHSQISKERVAQNFTGGTGKAGFGPFPDVENQVGKSRFKGMQAFPDEDFPDVLNANEIIKILGEDQEKPFFMMYGLWRPHSPYTCPQRFYDMYNTNTIQLPPGFFKNDIEDLPLIAQKFIETEKNDFNSMTKTEQLWKAFLRGYYACYSFADWNIGRVLNALEKSKYVENTIVIVTSDNGFHMGEKNRFNKNSLWELSAITPTAVRVPGTKYAGKVCFKPINLQDLYPTFVDYCGNGVQPHKPIDGNSIRPLIENPDTNWEHPSITYFGKGWVSIRNEQFRYLRYPDGSEELYDHSLDNWELNNLAWNKNYTLSLIHI
jgi:arylsulfatase A-like enzyme